jgi:hypothetical protein
MSCKTYLGMIAWTVLLGAVAVVNGCSSSSSPVGGSPDAGSDVGIVIRKDGGSASGSSSGSSSGGTGDDTGTGDDGGTAPTDGTSGKACTTDLDCGPGGAGHNFCTGDADFGPMGTTAGMGATLFPTATCFNPNPCNSGSDGNPHFCDGPDDPSSPGYCFPVDPTNPANGECFPKCTFKTDGSAQIGCPGKDACNNSFFIDTVTDPAAPTGIGYCYGGCETSADCQTGQQCQTDQGLCLAPGMITVDPAPGTGCNQNATNVCPTCLAPSTTGIGFCSQFCKVGGTVPCAAGSICDAQLPTTLIGANDAEVPGWTAANPGMAGFCSPKCEVDGGAQTEGGSCYTNTQCVAQNVGGPDCLP